MVAVVRLKIFLYHKKALLLSYFYPGGLRDKDAVNHRVPSVNVVLCRLMICNNVIVGITIFRGSFMFSQSRVKVPASLTNVGSLAVGAFDLVNCSLSVVGFVLAFNVGQ